MTSAPRVSCVMPAYNYERFIAAAIESALGQDYPEEALEILVVDDGSTDGTPQVVAPYLERIRYIRQENRGITQACNRALEEATGKYVAFLDADDLWPPHKTARQVEFLESHPHVGLLHGDMEVIDPDGNPMAPSFFRQFGLEPQRGRVLGSLLSRNFVSGGAIMMRSAFKPIYHPLPPEAAWTDWWFALRIGAVADIDHLDEPLYRYRYHGDNELFGATGERLVRVLADRDLPWRRWILTHVEPHQAGAAELVAAWTAFQGTITTVAAQTATSPPEVLAVDAARRELAERAADRARVALRERDVEAVACHLLRALGHDPFHPWAVPRMEVLRRWHAPGPRDPAAGTAPGPAPEDLRGFVTLAFADELVDDPGLLAAYAEAFSGADDATLLICACGWRPDEVAERLGRAVAAAGLDGEGGADLLAYPCASRASAEPMLAERADAVLSRRAPAEELPARPRFQDREAGGLRELAELRWATTRATPTPSGSRRAAEEPGEQGQA